VGEPAEAFGEELGRLQGPRYGAGYLPIVQVAYTHGQTVYEQEAFAGVRPPFADRGTVFVRFTARGAPGTVTVSLDRDTPMSAATGSVQDSNGQTLVLFDAPWSWNGAAKELRVKLAPDHSAVLAVLTQPRSPMPALTAALYEEERASCRRCWQTLLDRGMKLEVPEPQVNDVWRALVIGNFLIADGDLMNYSAGNAYDHLYEAECGDATRALLLYGFTREARQMVGPLLRFNRQATRFHVAGHKLQLLAHYYWVTRDAAYLR